MNNTPGSPRTPSFAALHSTVQNQDLEPGAQTVCRGQKRETAKLVCSNRKRSNHTAPNLVRMAGLNLMKHGQHSRLRPVSTYATGMYNSQTQAAPHIWVPIVINGVSYFQKRPSFKLLRQLICLPFITAIIKDLSFSADDQYEYHPWLSRMVHLLSLSLVTNRSY
jgi:hypothetical protein